jgi:hypothetical protein
MTTTVLVEEPAWERLGDIESLAVKAVNSVFTGQPCKCVVFSSVVDAGAPR